MHCLAPRLGDFALWLIEPRRYLARRYIAIPFLHRLTALLERHIPADGQHGIVRRIVRREKCPHILDRYPPDMLEIGADGRHSVRMLPVEQRVQPVREVAVGLVQAGLLEFLHHHRPLRLQHALGQRRREHPVTLKPQQGLQIHRGRYVIEVREVRRGARVVHAAGTLHLGVKVGDMLRPAEHQVLEQMRYPRQVSPLVARPHVVERVHRHHRRRRLIVVHHSQSVPEGEEVVFCHGLDSRFSPQSYTFFPDFSLSVDLFPIF